MQSQAGFMPRLFNRVALPYWQGGILVLLTAWLYRPLLTRLAQQWWQDPNYTHGFFVPVFSLFLLWDGRAKLAALRIKPSWWGLVMLVFALIMMVLGTISSGFFLSRVSLLLLICGMVVFLAGWQHLAAVSFPLAFLILMIPSSMLVEQITFPLQILASNTATLLLNVIGVSAVREGNIILLPTARLEVAEACSGIRSLFSLITLTVIYGYLAETKTAVRVLLALIAVPVSILANALRITVTGLVVNYWGLEGAQGTLHLLSGWLIFAGSLLLIFVLHRLSRVFLSGQQKPAEQGEYA
jgi:exosortase